MKHGPRFHTAPEGARCIDNGNLFMVAVEAAKKIEAPAREGGESQAWVSIAFSVITLESFLNETLEFAESAVASGERNPFVALFAKVMAAIERASLEDKFSVAHVLVADRPADFGSHPYQDLPLLVALRNELTHFKPTAPISYAPEYHPVREKLRAKLDSKNILAEAVEYAESWIFHVGTKAVAEWACKTTAGVIVDFMDKARDA
jgi:hypothetical protein